MERERERERERESVCVCKYRAEETVNLLAWLRCYVTACESDHMADTTAHT